MRKFLGIEFGSTRIKAVLIGEDYKVLSSSDYVWKSDLINGYWTYNMEDAIKGLKATLNGLTDIEGLEAVGISGMMHGLLAFDKNWNLLTPFRTWQNTTTARAADKLTELFGFNIPQRWSIAHLYQAILNEEKYIKEIAHITTLAGYVHYLLTGENVVGIGEASGMFPIDSSSNDYDEIMLEKFDKLIAPLELGWKLRDLLPSCLLAGEFAGKLSEEGRALTDNVLPLGVAFAPPEGDAQTGMTATNSVLPKTGNVSAGTSIFAMIVLEKPLEKLHKELNVITTPEGKPVALVHSSNCTSDSNAWVSVLKESAELFGAEPANGETFTKLYEKSLEGDSDCGGVLVCNYITGEGITHFDSGIPMIIRKPDAKFTLANLFKAMLYSTMTTLKIGVEILADEKVEIASLTGHGGLFKTPAVGQKYMAAAFETPITCLDSASEGGPFGIALLAAFVQQKDADESLGDFLKNRVFKKSQKSVIFPDQELSLGFKKYFEDYKKLLEIEKRATELF